MTAPVVPIAGQPLPALPPPAGCPCCLGLTVGTGWRPAGQQPWQRLCDGCLWYAARVSACPHVLTREAA